MGARKASPDFMGGSLRNVEFAEFLDRINTLEAQCHQLTSRVSQLESASGASAVVITTASVPPVPREGARMPWWWSWETLYYHIPIGGGCFALIRVVVLETYARWGISVAASAGALLGTLALWLAHEHAYAGAQPNEGFWSDFKRINGGPLNGSLDLWWGMLLPIVLSGVWR